MTIFERHLALALLAGGALLAAGCPGRELLRTEGTPLELGSRDLGEKVLFSGEAEAGLQERAIRAADTDARR